MNVFFIKAALFSAGWGLIIAQTITEQLKNK